jgi:hypothetical protein
MLWFQHYVALNVHAREHSREALVEDTRERSRLALGTLSSRLVFRWDRR